VSLCKRLSTLTCKECGLNLCYLHAVGDCKIVGRVYVVIDGRMLFDRHQLDGIPATFCTIEVDSNV